MINEQLMTTAAKAFDALRARNASFEEMMTLKRTIVRHANIDLYNYWLLIEFTQDMIKQEIAAAFLIASNQTATEENEIPF